MWNDSEECLKVGQKLTWAEGSTELIVNNASYRPSEIKIHYYYYFYFELDETEFNRLDRKQDPNVF